MLTEQEWTVLEHLARASGAYMALPIQREEDCEDFTRSIHELQRIVMCRLARRVHPPGSGEPGHAFTTSQAMRDR